MASRLAVGLLALALAAACQLPGSPQTCNVMIEWVNFIQVGSTQYVTGLGTETVLEESDLGPVYSQVKFKVSGNVCDPGYRLKDGDAAFLDPGTPMLAAALFGAVAAGFSDDVLAALGGEGAGLAG